MVQVGTSEDRTGWWCCRACVACSTPYNGSSEEPRQVTEHSHFARAGPICLCRTGSQWILETEQFVDRLWHSFVTSWSKYCWCNINSSLVPGHLTRKEDAENLLPEVLFWNKCSYVRPDKYIASSGFQNSLGREEGRIILVYLLGCKSIKVILILI